MTEQSYQEFYQHLLKNSLLSPTEYQDLLQQVAQRTTATGQMMAQQRANMAVARHQIDYMRMADQLQDSRAYSQPHVEEDFPIKFIPKSGGFIEFHSQMEKGRSKADRFIDLRYLIARSAILYIAIQLIWRLI